MRMIIVFLVSAFLLVSTEAGAFFLNGQYDNSSSGESVWKGPGPVISEKDSVLGTIEKGGFPHMGNTHSEPMNLGDGVTFGGTTGSDGTTSGAGFNFSHDWGGGG